MIYLWLIPAVLCMLYYIRCATYAGIGSSFIFIWLIGTAFFLGVFILRMLLVKNIIFIPIWIKLLLIGFISVCLIIFISTELLIVGKMNSKADDDCKYMIVLGCQIRGDRITKSLAKRLDKAIDYAYKHPDTMIIVSGGQGPGENTTEAEAMKRYLVEKGIPAEMIIKEEKSVDTNQNMEYSSVFIKNKNDKIAIVTSNFHIYRALKLANAKGMKNVCGEAAESDSVLKLNYFVREAIGVVKDFTFGNF